MKRTTKKKKTVLRYQLNDKGIEHFADDVLSDVTKALSNEKEPDKLRITLGCRLIEMSLYAETYEELIHFLENAFKIENE